MIKRILSGILLAFWTTSSALALSGLTQSSPHPATTEPDPAQKAHFQQAYGKLPLFFIQNDGQLNKQVRF